MKIAIMQPYLFPYIGYFQLIQSVDKFVIFDDVNYIKKGWINRNCILSKIKNERIFITLPLKKASQNKKIKDLFIYDDGAQDIINKVKTNYRKAPQFDKIFTNIKDILLYDNKHLVSFLYNTLISLFNIFNFKKEIILSSEIIKNENLIGEDKIIEICKNLGATEYINLPGGRNLYNKEHFKNNNIKLSFIIPDTIKYQQFNNEFISSLSIIDIMMFNSILEIQRLIQERYTII